MYAIRSYYAGADHVVSTRSLVGTARLPSFPEGIDEPAGDRAEHARPVHGAGRFIVGDEFGQELPLLADQEGPALEAETAAGKLAADRGQAHGQEDHPLEAAVPSFDGRGKDDDRLSYNFV